MPSSMIPFDGLTVSKLLLVGAVVGTVELPVYWDFVGPIVGPTVSGVSVDAVVGTIVL